MKMIASIEYNSETEQYELENTKWGNKAEVPEETFYRWWRIQDEYKQLQDELYEAYNAKTTKHAIWCRCVSCNQ